MRHQIKVYAHLRTQQRQENQEPNQSHHSVRLKTGKLLGEYIGKQTYRNTSPVKRRQKEQIEDGQNDIDDECVLEIQCSPPSNGDWQIGDQMKTQRCDNC